MSEPEKNENIPEASARKGISNIGNTAKSKEDFNLAAIYVSDAQYNRNVYFDTLPQAVRLYMLYNHWALKVLLYFFMLVNLSLAIFEDPAVYPLPIWATMLVEILCLLIFTIRLIHYAKVILRDKFWKDPKNICIIVILTLTLVDMIIYGALKAANYYGVRWSRVLRPLLLVNVTEGRQLRRAFRSIRNALPQIFYVFMLFMFSILIFSLMALKLLGKRGLTNINGTPYFTSYLEIMFDLYVLVTTANSPDVMMPAYNANFFFAVFFIVYILINTYIFMSVFLAVVYNSYKKYLKEEVRQLVRAKRHKMVRAFGVLQEQREEGGEPVVTQASWNQLVRLVQPNLSNAHRELLWSVSDDKNQGAIASHFSSRQILDIVFILRVLRLIRVVDSIKRFRIIINTLIRIGPAILTFGQLIIVVYYIFAMVGMELFKGKVTFYEQSSTNLAKAYCGNPLLNGTDFAKLNYCKNNFNNVVSSFILLVELTVVNQWHVLSSGFATVTHISARIFFVLFHIIVVIVILNIFVAFVLEAFFVEYSVDKSDLQTSLERKIEELELAVAQETMEDNLVNAMETIDNDLGGSQSAKPNLPSLMFKIASKRYRTVDALLQRIFEADLDPEDFAENDDPETQGNENFANPLFSHA
ncbi:two pore segment channel 3 isoform X4 [Oreochromis niloticus]|uniref:two pore segment channel 3 isoform X4 n=1 Tax=Oreochromis niloticus TaxID=8128 RepID=UPI0009047AE9|nr:two pore calcium channel protein 1 isoform X4 [Oreochromis niloticus]